MRDDPEFNIKFVGIVENVPCLYDVNDDDYHRNQIQERAWCKIAKYIGEGATAKDCKARWRNLRGRFTKHLKSYGPNGSGTGLKRPYYLAQFMNFLLPFMKSRPSKGNVNHQRKGQPQSGVEDNNTQYYVEELICPDTILNSENEGQDSNEEADDTRLSKDDQIEPANISELDEDLAHENEDDSASTSFQSEETQAEINTSQIVSKKRTATVVSHSETLKKPRGAHWFKSKIREKSGLSLITIDDANRSAFDYFEKSNTSQQKPQGLETNDSDALFLMSLLPDLKRMNEYQKRKFKVGILNFAGEILGDGTQGSVDAPTYSFPRGMGSSSFRFPGPHAPGF